MRILRARGVAGLSTCVSNVDCNDGQGCTQDVCVNNECNHLPIPDCVPCELTYTCPPVDIVFIMDTSGSMRDEAAVLCSQVFSIGQELADAGINATINSIGITEIPGGPFACLFDTVVDGFGSTVPGNLLTCPFPGGSDPYESWGPATAIIAQYYPWAPGATRIIIPMSDEGPCNGSRPNGCNDPGDDRDSIENAIAVCLANNVIASPIAGTSSDACVINLGTALAKGTGGKLHQLKNPKNEFRSSLIDIIHQTCLANAGCDDQNVCTKNDTCVDGRCQGSAIEGCRICEVNGDCGDNNPCTTDKCVSGICEWAPAYDASQCCNPLTGNVVPTTDGNPCTDDICDLATGNVTHPPSPQGVECVDVLTCEIDGRCDGNGHCQGTDVNDLSCQSDPDCGGVGVCNQVTHKCECNEIPSLCLEIKPGGSECHHALDLVEVNVVLGASIAKVVATQFVITFNPNEFEVFGIVPGSQADPSSHFDTEVFREVNGTTGTIKYAIRSFHNIPTTQQSLVARVQFKLKKTCGVTDAACVQDGVQFQSVVVTLDGRTLKLDPCCSTSIRVNQGPPVLSCPGSVGKNADAGRASALVEWSAPSVNGGCDTNLALQCTGITSTGVIMNSLAPQGGRFPIGTTSFHCTTTNSCGETAECDWEVTVHDLHTVNLEVQLSAPITPLPIVRCVELEFFSDCLHLPYVTQVMVSYGGLFNFPGVAKTTIKIPAGQYGCVTARDPLHTLRSTSSLSIVNNKYLVRFLGDPKLGGNWLVNGNLNGDRVIDISDHGMFLAQYQARLSPHTTCEGPTHADFDGDGSVGLSDLTFIERSLYQTDKGACCSWNVSSMQAPTTELPLDAETESLQRYDYDGDGVLDYSDMLEFMEREQARLKKTTSRSK